nr:site-specific integrase [Mesorhizobium sp. LMG 17147]
METRAARDRLKVGALHCRTLVPGKLALLYKQQKAGTPGAWTARRYVGKSDECTSGYKFERIGTADDRQDANGVDVFSFAQAQAAAHGWRDEANKPKRVHLTLTVAQAVEPYRADRNARDSKRRGRAVNSDASRRLRRYLLGQPARGKGKAIPPAPLAGIALSALEEKHLRAWRSALPATLKTTTVLRLVNDLKAALNAAYEDNRVALPASFAAVVKQGLKTPKHDDDDDTSDPVARESQILSDRAIGHLIQIAREVDAEQGWEGDVFRMVLVLAATGARFSQLARLKVADCQMAAGRLMVPVSRKGRGGKFGSIPVPVGEDVLDALRPVVKGRPGDAALLERWHQKQIPGSIRWERVRRGPWQASSELPWQEIRKRAGMPDIIQYAFRHSSIVRGIRQNLPIRLVAALHDTSIVMIEQHYSRFIVSGLEEMARQAIVPLVPAIKADSKVVPIKPAGSERFAVSLEDVVPLERDEEYMPPQVKGGA